MILHTVVDPMEVMMQPQESSIEYRRIEGCLCACRGKGAACRIDRIISTDLDDYLNPRFAPGTMLQTKPKTF